MNKVNKWKLLLTLLSNLIFAEILLGFKIGKKKRGLFVLRFLRRIVCGNGGDRVHK